MTVPAYTCECSDPKCPVHQGTSKCTNTAVEHLRRIDMEDETGELFCEGCASDAYESGVFTVFEDEDEGSEAEDSDG